MGERAGFDLNHCFKMTFFIFRFTAETNIFPQKMGTQLKPHFPKGNFYMEKKKKSQVQPAQCVGMGREILLLSYLSAANEVIWGHCSTAEQQKIIFNGFSFFFFFCNSVEEKIL